MTADASGEARVPVVAPPGARFAYQRDKPLDLNVPPVLHVHLALGRPEAPADAAHDLPLRAFVVAPSGAPRAVAPLRVEVSEGRVVDLAEIAPGSWAGTWRLAPGRAGVARASAGLADEPGLTAVAQVPRAAGPLARLSVQSTDARVAADGAVLLRVVGDGRGGNPVETAPEVEATLGELSKLVRVGPGTWEARLAVPPRVGAIRRLQARRPRRRSGGPYRARGFGGTSGRARGLVGAGRARRGRRRGGARAGPAARPVRQPREGPAPEVVATRRADIAAEPDGPGAWVVRYRPSRAREDRAETLSVRAGGLEGAARLAIVAPERRLGLAPKLGLAVSAGGLRAPYGAVEATYRSPLLAGRLAFGLELGGFVHDRTDAARVGDVALAVHGRARYLPALCTARWEVRVGERQALWAGAGGGVAHVRSEVSADGGPVAVEQGIVPVVHGGAGWALRSRHGGPFVEARVARHGDPQFDALRGSLTVVLGALG